MLQVYAINCHFPFGGDVIKLKNVVINSTYRSGKENELTERTENEIKS